MCGYTAFKPPLHRTPLEVLFLRQPALTIKGEFSTSGSFEIAIIAIRVYSAGTVLQCSCQTLLPSPSKLAERFPRYKKHNKEAQNAILGQPQPEAMTQDSL